MSGDTQNLLHEKMTCVFVHGWAMNSRVWDPVVERLPPWIDVILLDLPGHGTMNDVRPGSLDDVVKTLSALVHRPVLWVGWSLGGLALLRLCQLHPERVASALLVATNPCFVTRDNWPTGVSGAVFDNFADDLQADRQATVRRFLALQVQGQPGAMRVVRRLQESMRVRGEASDDALHTGLDILRQTDLRMDITSLQMPLSWVLGDRDQLVPVTLAGQLSRLGQRDVTIYRGAGHAPFITDPDRFAGRVTEQAASLCRAI